jgi:ribose/xylose/arabinose/galactoside ABC-type transport system permease subunit
LSSVSRLEPRDINPTRASSAQQVRELLFRAGPLLALIGLGAYLSFASSNFLTVGNLSNIGRQSSSVAILALGQTFVILTGGIDLSVAAIAALTSALTAVMLTTPITVFGFGLGSLPVEVCLGIGLVVGILAGALNGWIIATFKIPDFIATLGTISIFRGIALLITGGLPVPSISATRDLPPILIWFGSGDLAGFPVSVMIALLCGIVAWYVLGSTVLGRAVYAVGGNREAARACGISVGRVKIYVYAISGLLAAFAGFLLVGRLGAANALLADGEELRSIASVVIGGTNLFGGEGGVFGSMIGAALIGVLSNGLNLLDVSPFYQRIAQGVVIVCVVIFDQWRRRSLIKS